MSAIRVHVALSNGEWLELEAAPDLLHRIRMLEAHGTPGREVIQAVWGDTWVVSPEFIRVTGTDEAGRQIDLTIFND